MLTFVTLRRKFAEIGAIVNSHQKYNLGLCYWVLGHPQPSSICSILTTAVSDCLWEEAGMDGENSEGRGSLPEAATGYP